MHVYEDSEFVAEVERLLPDRKKYLAAMDMQASNDDKMREYTKMRSAIKDVSLADMTELAEKYAVTVNDILLYMDGQYETWGFYRKGKKPYQLHLNTKTRQYRAQFDEDITREEFLTMWDFIARNKDKKHNGKIPQPKLLRHHALLYAMFKGRQHGMTFPEMYKLYTERQLPYFIGEKPTEFNTPEKFAEYYHNNKPKTSRPV